MTRASRRTAVLDHMGLMELQAWLLDRVVRPISRVVFAEVCARLKMKARALLMRSTDALAGWRFIA